MSKVIEVNNLSKWYHSNFFKKISILNNLNFEVNSGEIFGFLGANGAGKTTTIKILMGLTRLSSGNVCFFGKPVSQPNSRKSVAFLPEHPEFPKNLDAYDFLKLSASLSQIKISNQQIKNTLKEVNLSHVNKKRIDTFSKGMRQRLGIAQVILSNPDLLILDEPMSGLDPIGRQEVSNLLVKLNQQGKTIFFSTHILADAQHLCHRIAFLKKGELLKVHDQKSFEEEESRRVLHVSKLEKSVVQTLADHLKIEYQETLTGTWYIRIQNDEQLWKLMEEIRKNKGHVLSVGIDPEAFEQYWS